MIEVKKLLNNDFQDFLNRNKFKVHSSRNTSVGAVFAGHFNRTIKDIRKRPVLEKGESNWVDILSTETKQYNNRVHVPTKLTPVQASLKKKEGYVYRNLLDERKNLNQNFN